MNKYLSIIILNINGLNAPIKRNKIAEWIRTHDPHICCLQEIHQNKRPTQIESKGLETNIPSKWTGKKSWGNNTHTRQNRLQNKGNKERPRRSLHNTQGKNPSRNKYYKHICIQHRSTHTYMENLGRLQERYRQQHTYTGGFNIPLSTMDRSSKQNINKDILELNNTLDYMDLTDYISIYIYLLSSQRRKLYILFKCIWNIFKDRPLDRTQNKPQQIQEN